MSAIRAVGTAEGRWKAMGEPVEPRSPQERTAGLPAKRLRAVATAEGGWKAMPPPDEADA